jgi:hypothetical protein
VTTDDMVNEYLAELDRVTVGLEPTTRADLLQEVRQHIIDAQAAGEDVHEVLARLGSPAEIAQAAGLVVHPSRPRQPIWLKRAITAFVAVVALGYLGLVAVTYYRDAHPPPAPLADASKFCGSVGQVTDRGRALFVDGKGAAARTGTASADDVFCVLDYLTAPSAITEPMKQARNPDGRESQLWDRFNMSWTYHPINGLDVVIHET